MIRAPSREGPALSTSIDRPPRTRPNTTPSLSLSASRRTVRGSVGASLVVLAAEDSATGFTPQRTNATDDTDDAVIVDEVLSSAEPTPIKARQHARPAPAGAPTDPRPARDSDTDDVVVSPPDSPPRTRAAKRGSASDESSHTRHTGASTLHLRGTPPELAGRGESTYSNDGFDLSDTSEDDASDAGASTPVAVSSSSKPASRYAKDSTQEDTPEHEKSPPTTSRAGRESASPASPLVDDNARPSKSKAAAPRAKPDDSAAAGQQQTALPKKSSSKELGKSDGLDDVVLCDRPDVPRRPATAASNNRPRHVALGRKELVGKGTFGMVYRAMDLDTNRIIAVKEITIAPGTMKPETLESLRKEIALMQRLDHPCIVKCLGEHWDGQQSLRIFMEYVAGGTISSILRSFGPFNELQASRYTKQMLEGLVYLHDQRIAHRDLKGDNLLVDVDGSLKLADFGTAKELATKHTKSIAGTAFFMAPEVIRGTGHGLEADVWSIGCCIVEMLTGKPPFTNFSNQYAIMMHVAELKEFPLPSQASPLCSDFLSRCVRPKAEDRWSVRDLLAHEWIVNPPQPTDLRSINVLSASDSNVSGDAHQPAATAASPTAAKSAADVGGASINPIQSFGPDSPAGS